MMEYQGAYILIKHLLYNYSHNKNKHHLCVYCIIYGVFTR
jgi:hypothetical protein